MFVGCEWPRDREQGTVKLSQTQCIRKLAKRFGGKFTAQDMPYGASKEKRDAFENMPMGTAETMMDRLPFLEAIGSTGWPSVMTRPELAFTYSVLGSHSMHPLPIHFEAAMHAVGYLVNTEDVGPTYGGKPRIPPGLQVMPPWFLESSGLCVGADASWGKKPRPHGGHVVMRCNGPIVWASKILKVVADGSTEAETDEASRGCKSAIFTKQVLCGAMRPAPGPVPLLGDNSAMHQLIQKDGASARTRHYERATVFVKYAVLKLFVKPFLISTDHMIADVFTKAADKGMFLRCRNTILNTTGAKGFHTIRIEAQKLQRGLVALLSRLF